MKKKIFFLALILISSVSFSQSEQIPEGWDKIILEGEVAYMNLVNGEISNTLPKEVARAEQEVKEFEPTEIHYVKSGDTFSKIARQYNLSLSELYRLNSLDNFDQIKVGQEVVVGYKSESSVSGKEHHTVKSNETLYSISQLYGISVIDLKDLNYLNTNVIIVGQRLLIK